MLAPITLFVYNRPWHTRQTLEALAKNKLADQSHLIVYCDGPKENADQETLEKIKEVRAVVREKQWCKSIEVIESDKNKGLANSIIEGVTKVVNQYGKIIVLEDDLITSEWFLTFMNEGLNQFELATNVYSVNGYMFPIDNNQMESKLLPYAFTWGWGTWRDKWKIFDRQFNDNKMPENQKLISRFNLADYNYYDMLKTANHSWGINWYYSVFIRNGLGVFPSQSLISNIGFDGTGVNCGDEGIKESTTKEEIKVIKTDIIDLSFYSEILKYFTSKGSNNKPKKHVLKKITNYLNGI